LKIFNLACETYQRHKELRKYLIILILGIGLILTGCILTDNHKIPVAKKGVLDLRGWDFEENGMIDLKGEWEFYWDTLYTVQDFKNNHLHNKEYINFGKLWSNFSTHKYPYQGKATYHLKILSEDTTTFLNFYFVEPPYSASKIFVNGVLIGGNGRVSENKQQVVSSYHYETRSFKSDTLIDIIVHVVNYEPNRSGGIIFDMVLGNAQAINFLKQKVFIVQLLISGGIIVLMIYHLALFLMWRNSISNLFFSIFSFFTLLYFSSISFLHYFIDDFLVIRFFRILGWFMAVPVFTIFVRSIFPVKINKTIVTVLSITAVVSFIAYLLKIEYIVDFYKGVMVLSEVYILITSIKILQIKSSEAKVFFLGVMFIALSGINDGLSHLGLIKTPDMVPFGVFFFLFAQSYILASRSAKAYKENKELSKKLINTNKNLEHLVIKRTKQIEEQNISLAELNATKDRFFGIIAHNLRGPVGNWASSLGLLIDTYKQLDDDTKLELITSLKSSTDKTFHLLENLLIWSRIQRNIITYSPHNVAIKDLIEENIEMLKPSADFKNITLNIEIDEELKAYCDAYMINNVIRNLLSNAIKFTRENGKVNIKTGKSNGYAEIIIEDNGIGIDDNIKKRLFKIEHHIMSKGTKGETGSGLGLILCKEFIDKHNGEIQLESQVNKGTTVIIKLPVN